MLSSRQQHCLRGMGVRLWRQRSTLAAPGERAMDSLAPDAPAPALAPEPVTATVALPARENPPPVATAVPGPETIPVAAAGIGVAAPTAEPPSALDDWAAVDRAILACSACELAQNCTQKVPGVGNRSADLMIIGEGPGHDEDIRGEPFVGRSGQLLDRMLKAIGIARDQVFITNIVKCRPPNNRDPRVDEARQCRTFLDAQIALIAPRVILSVGRISAHNLLGCNDSVGKMIGSLHRLPGSDIPLKVTYHPAYLLRNPAAKAVAWNDLKLLHGLLQ